MNPSERRALETIHTYLEVLPLEVCRAALRVVFLGDFVDRRYGVATTEVRRILNRRAIGQINDERAVKMLEELCAGAAKGGQAS